MIAVSVVRELPADWREQLFAGALLVVTDVAALAGFRAHAEGLVAAAFAPAASPTAQRALGDTAFRERIPPLRDAFRRDQRVRELLGRVVAAFGLDAATTYWDPPRLRVLPAGADLQDRDDIALEAHRDTWSSNVYAQVNWWIPLHAVTAERAIAFYPRHWSVPVTNTSGTWDLEVLRAERAAGGPVTVPLVPTPSSPLDRADAVAVVVQPGDLLLFSGAHLHATVANTSGTPRYSVEVRTVALDDVRSGRGAPNIDGAAPHVPWEWFRRIDDQTPLHAGLPGNPE